MSSDLDRPYPPCPSAGRPVSRIFSICSHVTSGEHRIFCRSLACSRTYKGPAPDPTFTMRGSSPDSNGRKLSTTRLGPMRLTLTISDGFASCMNPRPALLTMASSLMPLAVSEAAADWTDSSLPTSISTSSTGALSDPACSLTALTAASPRSAFLAPSSTLAPWSFTSCLQSANPMPELAPVTRMVVMADVVALVWRSRKTSKA
mmetsp:Transcript_9893/g.27015  ORF Transcript_9893/g.27015 Transcript_9893/m.27015 type:complete len:204 (+) Transcript_9893:389-1000(+)